MGSIFDDIQFNQYNNGSAMVFKYCGYEFVNIVMYDQISSMTEGSAIANLSGIGGGGRKNKQVQGTLLSLVRKPDGTLTSGEAWMLEQLCLAALNDNTSH